MLDTLSLKNTQEALSFKPHVISKALELLTVEKATVPFVARYRKEATGGLEDVDLIKILDHYESSLEIEKRRSYILETLTKSEKLTPELKNKITTAKNLIELEDIYAPFKSKRKTKGQTAKDLGLEPLSLLIKTHKKNSSAAPSVKGSSADLKSTHDLQSLAQKFITKDVKNTDEAISGAMDILVEETYQNADLKAKLRDLYWSEALLVSKAKKDFEKIADHKKYSDYFEYSIPIKRLTEPKQSYKFLALQRGASEKVLKVDVLFDHEIAKPKVITEVFTDFKNLTFKDTLCKCIDKALLSYLHSSLSLELKSELKKIADESAIGVFKENLKNLLLQPYLGSKKVLGIDPGVRTGCKIAIIDKNGDFIDESVIYPHPPKNDLEGSVKKISEFINKFEIDHIAVGSGTYGRETLTLLNEHVTEVKSKKTKAVLISEDGASIYSASEIARSEFPDLDVTVRGAISIARRFQDPLAELVKIDPKSLGVGQYQHDVNQVKLKKSLDSVVESCVNYVGVDLNTASAPLLSYVSGLGESMAKNIVSKRKSLKGFKSRDDLKSVSRFSEKNFEQAAGFLRVYTSKNPLDHTFIHPENYPLIDDWCKKNSVKVSDLVQDKSIIQRFKDDSKVREAIGVYTHEDIVKALLAPSQDPRKVFTPFDYKEGLKEITDLKVGVSYPGIVTNITQFGAFVDIGIKENGLIHISEMSNTFVKDPLEVLKVGQEVKAKLIALDIERKRVSLSLKDQNKQNNNLKHPPHQQQQQKQRQRSQVQNQNTPSSNSVNDKNPFSKLKGFKV